MGTHLVHISDCGKRLFLPGTDVFLDDRLISNECFYAEVYSNGMGRVKCYRRDADGKFFVLGRAIATEELVGRIDAIPPRGVLSWQWRALQAEWRTKL